MASASCGALIPRLRACAPTASAARTRRSRPRRWRPARPSGSFNATSAAIRGRPRSARLVDRSYCDTSGHRARTVDQRTTGPPFPPCALKPKSPLHYLDEALHHARQLAAVRQHEVLVQQRRQRGRGGLVTGPRPNRDLRPPADPSPLRGQSAGERVRARVGRVHAFDP